MKYIKEDELYSLLGKIDVDLALNLNDVIGEIGQKLNYLNKKRKTEGETAKYAEIKELMEEMMMDISTASKELKTVCRAWLSEYKAHDIIKIR